MSTSLFIFYSVQTYFINKHITQELLGKGCSRPKLHNWDPPSIQTSKRTPFSTLFSKEPLVSFQPKTYWPWVFLDVCISSFILTTDHVYYCRRNLPVDLAEGVLRALCLQALGQVLCSDCLNDRPPHWLEFFLFSFWVLTLRCWIFYPNISIVHQEN